MKARSNHKTALILIDLQNDFCHPDGTASKRGKKLHKFQQTMTNITSLLQVARENKIPIIHAISEHSEWSESPSQKERFGRKEQTDSLSYCEPNSWGAEIYNSFTPTSAEKLVTKHRYSAFYQTNLGLILQTNKIEHIILVGLYTNVCVDTTARDGYMRDFHVTIPADCVTSDDKEKGECALHLLQDTFAHIISSKELIQQWNK